MSGKSLIPSHGAFLFREVAARAVGLANIALEASQGIEIANLGAFGEVILAAPTLAGSLLQFQDLMHTQTTTATIEIQRQRDGGVWFCHRLRLKRHVGRWHSDLYILQWMLKIARLADPTWSPNHIDVSSAVTSDRRKAIDSLGCWTSRFGRDCTGFAIPQSMLAMPVSKRTGQQPEADRCRESLIATAPAEHLAASLKQVLFAYRQKGWLTIEQVAEVSDSSVRTLQRRLAEEQTSFSEVLDLARLEAAATALETTEAKIADIAADLGYTEHGNFTRAFVRWAGVSPSQFRQQRWQI